ncbi:hypothetical protein BC830DRAFT_1096502 [Chytriomyces sp. MP71]|nr:hypothetical protein BC830DRAFT_1096502 [Chytriomyces sp. MP71]
MGDDPYQARYIQTLEERLDFIEKVRMQEARALALATDAKMLKDEVAALRVLCSQFGLVSHSIPVLDSVSAQDLRVSADSSSLYMELDNIEHKMRSVEDSSTQRLTPPHHWDLQLNSLQLTPWISIFRHMYPGKLATLGVQYRQAIEDSVKQFLAAKLPSHIPVASCKVSLTKGGNIVAVVADDAIAAATASKISHAIPAVYLADFKHWLDTKMQEITAKSGMTYKNVDDSLATVRKSKHSGYSFSNTGLGSSPTSQHMRYQDHAERAPLQFPTPLQARFSDGSPNLHEYRAWTDIIRVRHRTFQRASPPMSKHARLFLQNHSLPLLCVVPGSSLRIGKATFAIPASLHHAFLEYMEDAFLRDGVFGDPSLHSLYPRRISGGGPGWDDAPEEQEIANSSFDNYDEELGAVLADFLETKGKEVVEDLMETGKLLNHGSNKADVASNASLSPTPSPPFLSATTAPTCSNHFMRTSVETIAVAPSSFDENGLFAAVASELASLNQKRIEQPQVPVPLPSGPLHFPTPCPPLLQNGVPNTQQYRAWTDIIRTRHPTFQRASPQMCKYARYFIQSNRLPVLCLVPASSLRIGKATFSIPASMYHPFLMYMEDAFLKDGYFGEKTLHSLVPRRIPGGGPGWEDEVPQVSLVDVAVSPVEVETGVVSWTSEQASTNDEPSLVEAGAATSWNEVDTNEFDNMDGVLESERVAKKQKREHDFLIEVASDLVALAVPTVI